MDSVFNIYKSLQWINTIFEKPDKPHFLFDPLTTVIKLSMLVYKSPLTKIRISQQKISFCDPNPFQGINRWFNGDSRTNIHCLYWPILYFCYLKYILQRTSADESPHGQALKQMVDYFSQLIIDGLLCLKTTYCNNKNDLVINCLDLYLIMLGSEDENSIQLRYNKLNGPAKNLFEEFLKCWQWSNMEIIINLFRDLEKKRDDELFVQKTLDVIDSYLDTINLEINKLRDP